MSIRSRYEFAKNCYKECVILVLKKKRLYSYNEKNNLVSFKKIKFLKKLHINYIIIDDLDIIKREYEDNRYLEYYLKYHLNNILNNILDKERNG